MRARCRKVEPTERFAPAAVHAGRMSENRTSSSGGSGQPIWAEKSLACSIGQEGHTGFIRGLFLLLLFLFFFEI
jgi:hypothetical protein